MNNNNDESNIEKLYDNNDESNMNIIDNNESNMDNNNNEISLDSDQKLDILNRLLRNAFEKDSNLTAVILIIFQTIFDRIVEDFQD